MSRDKELFKDSWFVQEWMKEGEEKGVKKGAVQTGRKFLLAMIQAHFPEQMPLARKLAKGAKDPEMLEAVTIKVSKARDEQEVAQLLAELAPRTKAAKKS